MAKGHSSSEKTKKYVQDNNNVKKQYKTTNKLKRITCGKTENYREHQWTTMKTNEIQWEPMQIYEIYENQYT